MGRDHPHVGVKGQDSRVSRDHPLVGGQRPGPECEQGPPPCGGQRPVPQCEQGPPPLWGTGWDPEMSRDHPLWGMSLLSPACFKSPSSHPLQLHKASRGPWNPSSVSQEAGAWRPWAQDRDEEGPSCLPPLATLCNSWTTSQDRSHAPGAVGQELPFGEVVCPQHH